MKHATFFFSILLAAAILVPTPVSARVRNRLATGTVVSVHSKTMDLTVHEHSKRNIVIKVPVTATIKRGDEMLLLNQLRRGWKVAVRYQASGKILMATQVKVVQPVSRSASSRTRAP